jgi:hypothetical protein
MDCPEFITFTNSETTVQRVVEEYPVLLVS